MTHWNRAVPELNEASLGAVMNGEVAALRIAGFANEEECSAFRASALRIDVKRHDAFTSPMQLIGANFSNHSGKSKRAYFDVAHAAERDLQRIIEGSFDPVNRVVRALDDSWQGNVDIADEGAPYGKYFAGCIKTRTQSSAMHFDFVPHVARDYRISTISEQMAWNIYLAMPANCGQTTVYNHRVTREAVATDSALPPNFIDREAVLGAESFTFKAAVGDLVIFNSRCPHEIVVDDVREGEQRMQIGGFAGLLPDGQMVLWS
jgi:hypothetical protein